MTRMNSMRQLKTQKTVFIICALMIPVILMLVFTYYPAVKLVIYSFTDWDGIAKQLNFIGLKNWIRLFDNNEAITTVGHSLYYIAGGIVQNALALFLAVILNNKNLRGRNALRGVIVLPFILNGTAVSYMFRYVYDFSKGPLNQILKELGAQPVYWLRNPATVNWALAFVALWRYTGYLMVIYIASLQSIPDELYEAAQIDGAGAWQRFRYVTLPQLTEVFKLQMFLNISGAINTFDLPFVITSGGPLGASKTLAMRANELAFQYDQYGFASAYGVFCTIIIVLIYIAQDKLLYRKEKA